MTQLNRIHVNTIEGVTVIDFADSSIMDTLQLEQIGNELVTVIEENHCERLVLDFTKVKFFASRTLSLMLQLKQKLGEKGGWLGICSLKHELHKIFKLTRLDDQFNFYDSRSQALEAAP